jgi:transposase InsO family protein
MAGLLDRTHARLSGSGCLSEQMVEEIVSCRQRHPSWGPKKIATTLKCDDRQRQVPALSTIGEVLKREGLIKPRRRVAKRMLTRAVWPYPSAANEEWAIDYKGQWRLGDGSWSYPLTISDGYSRFLLCCDSHPAVSGDQTQRSMTEVFGEYGLPAALRMDRGTPFASHGHGMSLTKLSVWWLRLGIELHRINPGSPTENARHERIHRVLKEEVADPPQPSPTAQQLCLGGFRHGYNYERPHESLGMRKPAELYTPSVRQMPSILLPFDYPGHYERYRVRGNGTIALRGRELFVSEALGKQIVGLEQHAYGWKVYLGSYLLADIDDEHFRIVYIH